VFRFAFDVVDQTSFDDKSGKRLKAALRFLIRNNRFVKGGKSNGPFVIGIRNEPVKRPGRAVQDETPVFPDEFI
jgi:hypothetical protein